MHIRLSRTCSTVSSALLIAGLSLLLAACGGESSTSSGGPGGSSAPTTGPASGSGTANSGATVKDACDLVTREEAAAALGQPVNEAEVTYANAAKSDCNYTSVGNHGATVLYVQVDYGPRVRAAFDLAKQAYSAPQAMAGTGDAAFAIILGAPSAQVHFVKGDAYVIVVITNVADEARLEKAKEAARRAAGRL